MVLSIQNIDFFSFFVTIHGDSKHHAKNHPAMPSGAAKTAAFVFLMIFRIAYTLISENNQPLMCKHNEFDYFLKTAVNSNLSILQFAGVPPYIEKFSGEGFCHQNSGGWKAP